MRVQLEPPQIDNIPPGSLVDVAAIPAQRLGNIKTVEQAIPLYIELFKQQFTSPFGPVRKNQILQRFVRYLRQQHHSLLLSDLSYEDGQEFLDSLRNAHTGKALSHGIQQRYQGALRTFSRFLFQAGLIQIDVFFDVKWRNGGGS